MGLFEYTHLDLLIVHAEIKLKDIMSADQCVIYLLDHEKQLIKRYDAHKNVKIHNFNIGIIGEAIKTGCVIEVEEPDKNPMWNSLCDIETSLPTVTFPVKSSHDCLNF